MNQQATLALIGFTNTITAALSRLACGKDVNWLEVVESQERLATALQAEIQSPYAAPGRGEDSAQPIVGLLVKAAIDQEELATAYGSIGWGLAAQTCDEEARNFRQRAETFAAESKQSNGELCGGGLRACEFKQDANRHSQP